LIPQYVSKSLVGASSTGIGTLSSASPGVATLNTSNLDTQRRISIFSASGTLATATFTIIGTRQGGTPVRETITGPTSNVPVATTQDFLSVTSVSASSVINTAATFGTNTTGGTPWNPVNTHVTPTHVGCFVTFSSTSAGMTASMELTMDDPTTAFYAGSGGSGPSVPGGVVAPGGQQIPFNVPPQVINAVTFSSVTSNTFGALNIASTAGGAPAAFAVPIWGWRMTLTSSSTAAGISVNAAVIQAGIG
jgi:hypothetical protein